MTTEIKIRKIVYEIKQGDYVQYNGTCYLFCAGDMRILFREKHNAYTSIRLTAKALKEIDLSLCKEVKQGEVTRYYF